MTKNIDIGLKAGLSTKAASVYLALLESGIPLSPKALITKTSLHRQYVYDALHELEARRLVVSSGARKGIKYQAASPERLREEAEKARLDAEDGVRALMRIYERSPAGIVEIIRGSRACIEAEFQILREAHTGDFLDIVGGAGMRFVELFEGRVEEWENLRKQKQVKLRYIGSGEDVEHNKTESPIKNESRTIAGIGDIVNVAIRPESVSFNFYEPEIVTVRVRNTGASASQRALFEVLWKIAE